MVLLSKDNLRDELQRFAQESFRNELQDMEQRLKDAIRGIMSSRVDARAMQSIRTRPSSVQGTSEPLPRETISLRRSEGPPPSLSEHFDPKDRAEKDVKWMARARKCSMVEHDLALSSYSSFQFAKRSSVGDQHSKIGSTLRSSMRASSIPEKEMEGRMTGLSLRFEEKVPRASYALTEYSVPDSEQAAHSPLNSWSLTDDYGSARTPRGMTRNTGQIGRLSIESRLDRQLTLDTAQDSDQDSDSDVTEESLWLGGERRNNSRKEHIERNPRMRHTLHHNARPKHSCLVEAGIPRHKSQYDSDEDLSCWDSIQEFLMGHRFVMISGAAIVINIFIIGVETDYMARHWVTKLPLVFRCIDTLFCLYFLLEILLRIASNGWVFFTTWWNLFDLLTVVLQVGEEVTSHLTEYPSLHAGLMQGHLGILRVFRIFRLVRVMRVIRILSAFSALRMLVVSILDAMKSLLWTLVLILLAMFITSVYFTQIVTDVKLKTMSRNSEKVSELLLFYGTLDRTMLTLYQTISEGLHWDEAMEPLRTHCSPWMALVFCAYIAFVTFAMLNVITGVFVESAIQTANDDKKKVLMYQMRQLFSEADVDNSGTLSWEEFERQLQNPQLLSFLRVVDLDTEEAEDLFRLLDVNGENEISADEFVHGALRIHGFAKAIDLATFMHEYYRHSRRVEKALEVIYDQVKELASNADADCF